MSKIAVIRIRGLTGIKRDIKDALRMLGLYRKNFCVIVADSPSNIGAIKKVMSYVTYGEIDDETEKLLNRQGKRFER